ncbi:MAG TPA: ATP-binding protein [Geothermobacteraceae bacterium]|nr:ATP-binding protein [Geothermobacteraceae bacterium]
MVAEKTPPEHDDRLRKRAEAHLDKNSRAEPDLGAAADPLQLLHELQVHQLELEMQNAELRKTRAEVETLLDKYTDLYDFAPVGHFTLDRNGRICSANLTGADLLGIERSRLIDRPFADFLGRDDRPIFAAFLKSSFSCPEKNSCEMPLQIEGESPRRVQIQGIVSQSGEECRIAVLDVTELHRAKQGLLKNQKLESLGVLAGGIAHDFNNILTAVLGNISLARHQKNHPEKLSRLLEEAERATVRAKDLTKQLLTFAKGGEPVKRVFNVGEMLREATNFAACGSSAKCKIVIPEDLWPINADAGQISQVIHNLVINAIQAMPEGGRLSVSAENIEPRSGGEKFVKISIADTGSGIPEEHLQLIFEPYFSTKPQGSGLGLAVCHSIIKKHGGKIRTDSAPGQGTTFFITLPATAPVAENPSEDHSDLARGQGRILVMDDEAVIRNTAEIMLTALGYQVECTENGSEAILRYRKRMEEGAAFDVVIMDLTIPGGIGGKEALSQLQRIAPQVKAIVSSGYATDPVMASFREYGFSAVLCKPYRLEEMARVMKDLLNPAPEPPSN